MTLNSFKLFGLKRKLSLLNPVNAFIELHRQSKDREKD